jgi:hypothetical protein
MHEYANSKYFLYPLLSLIKILPNDIDVYADIPIAIKGAMYLMTIKENILLSKFKKDISSIKDGPKIKPNIDSGSATRILKNGFIISRIGV